MESQQIQKTKQVIDQRRQKLQHIKSRLQRKLQNKSVKSELQPKPTNSKTLINHLNHLNFNSNLFQGSQSSQTYQFRDTNKSPSVDKTFQFNSTLFKHLDKNQSQNKSKFQNTSSQFYRDNGDINAYIRMNENYDNQSYNYFQKSGSPRKDNLFIKEPQHDSSQANYNPANSNLFSQYDKFLQQINTKAKLPVSQIKRHLQKKQGNLLTDLSRSNLRGLNSNHREFVQDKINDSIPQTSLNLDQINNLFSTTRNFMPNKQSQKNSILNGFKQNKIKRQKEIAKKQKQFNHIKLNQERRLIQGFSQSTISAKMNNKKNESFELYKQILPPHPDKYARTQLTSDRKSTSNQIQFAKNTTESIDVHKEKLKFMLSEKKKNQLSCDKYDIDDSIQYELSQDQEQDILNKKKIMQNQKAKRLQRLLAEKQNLRKQLKIIDNELESLQAQS